MESEMTSIRKGRFVESPIGITHYHIPECLDRFVDEDGKPFDSLTIRLGGIIFSLSNSKNQKHNYRTNKGYADHFGVGERTIERAFEALRDYGFISCDYEFKQARKLRTVRWIFSQDIIDDVSQPSPQTDVKFTTVTTDGLHPSPVADKIYNIRSNTTSSLRSEVVEAPTSSNEKQKAVSKPRKKPRKPSNEPELFETIEEQFEYQTKTLNREAYPVKLRDEQGNTVVEYIFLKKDGGIEELKNKLTELGLKHELLPPRYKNGWASWLCEPYANWLITQTKTNAGPIRRLSKNRDDFKGMSNPSTFVEDALKHQALLLNNAAAETRLNTSINHNQASVARLEAAKNGGQQFLRAAAQIDKEADEIHEWERKRHNEPILLNSSRLTISTTGVKHVA
jgi:hypothetical protein